MNIDGIYYKNIVIDYYGVYHLWAIPLRSKNVKYTQKDNK